MGVFMHARAHKASWLAASALLAAVPAAGCHVAVADLAGKATDEWVRSYELPPGGEISVSGTNGAIDLEGYDGRTIEVRAERTARAMTDEAARDLVARIAIEEEVTPERVAIRTEGVGGILVGVSYSVKYTVRLPHSVVARMRVTNGPITAKRFGGHFIATSTNGSIVAEELSGRIEAQSTNGSVRIGLGAVAPGGVSIRTVNGRLDLALPESGKADLSATCRNGTIQVSGLPLDPFGEQTRRNVQGKLNGGGAPIELNTVNGSIRVRSHTSEP
jgi:hypothetical protein